MLHVCTAREDQTASRANLSRVYQLSIENMLSSTVFFKKNKTVLDTQ
jgi:hypothetical protein